MSDENYVFLTGRVANVPNLRTTSSGVAVCDINVANNRYFRSSKDGETHRKTVFIRCTIWDKRAEFVGEQIEVGDLVSVHGVLVDDSYTDKETGQEYNNRLKLDHCKVNLLAKKRPTDNPEEGIVPPDLE